MTKEPFHSGEIYHLWNYLYEAKEIIVTIQVARNHTEDKDLKLFLDDIMESNLTEEEQQVEVILKETGIRLPPAPPDKPNVEIQDIPAGARFNDPEIARLVQKELLASQLQCSYIIGMSTQEDIKNLFEEFHSQKAEFEIKLLTITKDKGWYTPPPINLK